MTTVSDNNVGAAEAGWYRDPAGTEQLRWWDGTTWTDYLAANPPLGFAGNARSRPQIGESTPVYNAFIWVIVLLPLLSAILTPTWHPILEVDYVGSQHTPVLDQLSVLSPWYIALVALAWTINLATIVFAILDRRRLERNGVWWPFHWAWAILAAPIYVIGRSVVVRKAAPGRGLAPVWVFIAVTVLTTVSLVIVALNYVQASNLALHTSSS